MAQGFGRAGYFLAYLTLSVAVAQLSHAGEVLRLKNKSIRAQDQSRVMMFSGAQRHEELSGKFFIVQFRGDLTESHKQMLLASGMKLHGYVPDDAIIVETESIASIEDLRNSNEIQTIVSYSPEIRVSEEVLNATSDMVVHVRLFDSADAQVVAEKLEDAGAINVRKTQGKSIYAQIPAGRTDSVALVDGVEWIEKYAPMMMHDFELAGEEAAKPIAFGDLTGYESGTKAMNFDAAWAKGLTGKGQIAAMADTGFDTGLMGALHGDFPNILKGLGFANGGKWMDENGHGTHVAGSVAGTGKLSNGKLKGGAYNAKLFVEGMWDNLGDMLAVPSSLNNLFQPAMNVGARVHTNSWGSTRNAYDNFAIQVDEFMWNNPELLILFAAGNSGVDRNKDGRVDEGSLGSPATAKNCLSVGASENYVVRGGRQTTWGEMKTPTQPESRWPAEPLASDKISDNPAGLAAFSSRGPTSDGRLKPDIVAPGVNILSARSSKSEGKMWGVYNDNYLYAGGTSMATPLTAGAATVLREYLIKIGISRPSAALVKGILMHSAQDLFPGQFPVGPKQELPVPRPNVHEGYGRVDVKAATQLKASQLKDEKAGVATGESKTISYKSNGGRRLIATLTYTDAPGAASAAKVLVNDLDIMVVDPKGKTVEKSDRINNVEMIEIANPIKGTYKVTVKGFKVPQGKSGKQPYALVVSSM